MVLGWSAPADHNPLWAAAGAAGPPGSTWSRRRALDDDLIALLQTVGDLDHLVVLNTRLDHSREGFAVRANDVHHLVALLASHCP
jgi:hypothetical protein